MAYKAFRRDLISNSLIITFFIPISYAQAVQVSEDLWNKFLKYDLCITNYNALSDEEKDLCHFIFDTEQSADDTVICERARRILAHDGNIGERITLEQLVNCFGDWDSCDSYKYGWAGYFDCVPDIKHLDGGNDYVLGFNAWYTSLKGKVYIMANAKNYRLEVGVSEYFAV